MRYAYEDLSSGQFETLIVVLCQRLLGSAVQGFSEGADGGRDAKFIGKADRFPSTAAPWTGVTIIQGKHTNGQNRSFSETDFFSLDSENTILGKELPRIIKLRASGDLDHYILFANRRLTALAQSRIQTHISDRTSIPKESIYICGVEQLELWLKEFSEVATIADLDLVDSPLIVSPDDLAEIVEALARQMEGISTELDVVPVARVGYEEKNRINRMTKEYARAQREKYLKESRQIKQFLAAPENRNLLKMYESVTEEFQLKILAKRKDHQTFDEILEYLVELLFSRDPVLRQRAHKRLTRAILFYMYWNCDIGESADAATE